MEPEIRTEKLPRIPASGILQADPDGVRRARERLAARKAELGLAPAARAVGISWRSSNAGFGQHKSISLSAWAPILSCEGVAFVSVQYGDTAAEVAKAETEAGTRIWQDAEVDPLADMDAAAAQIASLDLVISVSNTAAHLAGGLSHPLWLLAPAPGLGLLWYWGAAGRRAPFYPSIEVFRQGVAGDWAGVLAEAGERLRRWISHP